MKTIDQNISAVESAYNVMPLITAAIEGSNAWTTGLGSYLTFIRGTGARDLQGMITTIKGNIGFDRLQRMRQESPTGGALGQVAVQELEALQATIASLDQTQSEAALDSNLQTVLQQYERWVRSWNEAIMKEGSIDQKRKFYNTIPSGALYFTYDEDTDQFIQKRKR